MNNSIVEEDEVLKELEELDIHENPDFFLSSKVDSEENIIDFTDEYHPASAKQLSDVKTVIRRVLYQKEVRIIFKRKKGE